MNFSTLFTTLKDIQYIILPLLPTNKTYYYERKNISNDCYIQYSTYLNEDDVSYILRIYCNYEQVFEFSANTSTKYFTTITDRSLRIAFWKKDHPRYYARYDPENGRNDDNYTYFEFPCDYGYYFQRSTVQNTLTYEEYVDLDTESQIMQEEFTDLEFVSTALVLSDSYKLEVTEVLDMLISFLDEIKNNV